MLVSGFEALPPNKYDEFAERILSKVGKLLKAEVDLIFPRIILGVGLASCWFEFQEERVGKNYKPYLPIEELRKSLNKKGYDAFFEYDGKKDKHKIHLTLAVNSVIVK